MNFRALSLAAAFCALAIAPLAASASGSTTATLGVAADVPSNCTVAYNGGFHMSYDPLVLNNSSDLNSYAGFGLSCTLGTNPTFTPPAGPTYMVDNNNDKLLYTLVYSNTHGAFGIHNVASINFLATIPAGQDVPVGSYSDTATILVNF
jgi:spore coat protein U-like protein